MQTAKPTEDAQLPKWTAESLAALELLWRVIDSKNEVYDQMKLFGFGYTIKSTNTFKPYSLAQLDAKAKEMNFVRKEKKVIAQPPPQPPPPGEEKSGIGNEPRLNELDKVVKEKDQLKDENGKLKDENDKLRSSIHEHLGPEADELLKKENLAEAAAGGGGGLIAGSSSDANKVLDDPDFSFIKALQTAQQNFVVTDPSLPDNPIVYATQGFLNLTGYTLDQVLGRNCRFLQGPETDPKAVEKIRNAIEEGSDMSVCLLNYRVDGTTFWNQFFIAALRDAAGNITNYVGVQCKVSDQYAANVCKRQDEADQAMFQEQDDAPADEPPAQAIAPGEDGPAAAAAPAAAPAPPVAS